MHDIVDCDTPQQREAACTLLDTLYTEHSPDYVRAGITAMAEEGWKMIGVFAADGRCKATISYRIGMRLFCGRFMQLESMMVDPEFRREGLGSAIFNWLEERALATGCKRILLESYVENFPGHQFFYKQGYFIRGYVINKIL